MLLLCFKLSALYLSFVGCPPPRRHCIGLSVIVNVLPHECCPFFVEGHKTRKVGDFVLSLRHRNPLPGAIGLAQPFFLEQTASTLNPSTLCFLKRELAALKGFLVSYTSKRLHPFETTRTCRLRRALHFQIFDVINIFHHFSTPTPSPLHTHPTFSSTIAIGCRRDGRVSVRRMLSSAAWARVGSIRRGKSDHDPEGCDPGRRKLLPRDPVLGDAV